MISGSPRSSDRRDHRAHERRSDTSALMLGGNRERSEVGDGASLAIVVEPRGRDHHVPDHLTLDLRDERELRDEAVRRAEGFDQPRLTRLAERSFDQCGDGHNVVRSLGSDNHLHTGIVTTGTGATPTN